MSCGPTCESRDSSHYCSIWKQARGKADFAGGRSSERLQQRSPKRSSAPAWPEKAKRGFKDPIHEMIFPEELRLERRKSLQSSIPPVLQKSRYRSFRKVVPD